MREIIFSATANKTLIYLMLAGKSVIARDICNLKRDLSGSDEATDLVKEMQRCREKFQATITPVTDENQVQIIFVQTAHMKEAFRAFSEVLIVDAMYSTNKLRMLLFVFIVQDGNGGSQVVAYAFVPSKQQHVVSQLLAMFVQGNPDTANTKVAVVDKDFTEISAIRTTFPNSPATQLCQFHVKKAFRAAAGQLAKSVEERD